MTFKYVTTCNSEMNQLSYWYNPGIRIGNSKLTVSQPSATQCTTDQVGKNKTMALGVVAQKILGVSVERATWQALTYATLLYLEFFMYYEFKLCTDCQETRESTEARRPANAT